MGEADEVHAMLRAEMAATGLKKVEGATERREIRSGPVQNGMPREAEARAADEVRKGECEGSQQRLRGARMR